MRKLGKGGAGGFHAVNAAKALQLRDRKRVYYFSKVLNTKSTNPGLRVKSRLKHD